ncbi:MAG: hypothetical protein GY796_00320 [Chloroflexi bacterium]|nr:hypothetical protein [Chloroflexota bacterium]
MRHRRSNNQFSVVGCGFGQHTIQAAYGDYDSAPLTDEQAIMLLIGRKE